MNSTTKRCHKIKSALTLVFIMFSCTVFGGSKTDFPLIHDGYFPVMIIDKNDAEVVSIAAKAFANDALLVSTNLPKISNSIVNENTETAIIAGTLGKSTFIDKLAKTHKINANNIRNKWETFSFTFVNHPFKGIKRALVIAGSDRRATAFGIFELSRQMGVSPWVWWADVLPAPKQECWLKPENKVYGEPSVKYRGIFLNDEDWGLKPWSAANMDTKIHDIGPNTYARIFELMLRLKANYLWPAMHDCTKAFYFYPENPKLADKYAIVVGSSHCEPVLRNNVFEWSQNYEHEYGVKPGDWRYDTNKTQIFNYWDDRAKQSATYESVYTIGMRGVHDGSMPGPKDINLKVQLLDSVISDQRKILKNRLNLPANQIPQIFCPYKEVLTLYQRGLNLPEDVTIVWADDNHGYIRQLSTDIEQKRSGGSGVYYHLSYWGAPHDYLWLSSISPSLISFEMTKAYDFGARNVWIFNVGDIKPAEMEIQFAMDLAWNIHSWSPENAYKYVRKWAAETFGEKFADEIASIKSEYYRLGHDAKPEHTGMVKFTTNEQNERLNSYSKIAEKAEILKKNIPFWLQEAYFELIYYPVKGAFLMNKKIYLASQSIDLMQQGDSACLKMSTLSQEAFEEIKSLTKIYNTDIAHGKWNGIMSWQPRKLEVFEMPKVATSDKILSVTKKDSTYSESQTNFEISASDFIRHFTPTGTKIVTLNGLGTGGKGISVFPLNRQIISDKDLLNSPFVEYELNTRECKAVVDIQCLPTHSIHKGREVRFGISVNGCDTEFFNLETPENSQQWKTDVVRGYHSKSVNYDFSGGKTTIRIYLPDAGFVLNKIRVTEL